MSKVHLQPKQGYLYDLLTATGRGVATIIGFGGAKGGGKSAGSDNVALLLAAELGNKYPGIHITIVRRVFNDLKANHIDKIFEAYPELRHFYTDKDGLQLHNGSKIVFAYAETAGDVERKFRGGFESAFIFVDEAQQFAERELQDIEMAARWTKGSTGLPMGFCKLVLLFNPGGKGSDYLRRIFHLKQYRGKERPENYAFLHVFGWDNYEWFRGQVDIDEDEFYEIESNCGDDVGIVGATVGNCCRFHMFITQTSEGRKYDAFPESIRSGYLLGNFDHFEGQYFAGAWDEKACVLTRDKVEQIVKPWWTRWMAQDWGFGDHDCHLWFAVGKLSPSEWVKHFGGHTDCAMDVVVIYREHVISDRAEADLAMDIVNATPTWERRVIEQFFLSQDAFGQRARQVGANSVGQQFTEIMSRHGLPSPQPALQDRVNGWRFAYHCFRQANLRGATFNEERANQGPACFVSTECPNVIQSMPMAVRDDKNPEDVMRVAGVLWEDVTDAVRYGLMSKLGALWEAPVDVRRREVYDAYDAPTLEERTGPQMTALALAQRRFDSEENARYKRVKRRR